MIKKIAIVCVIIIFLYLLLTTCFSVDTPWNFVSLYPTPTPVACEFQVVTSPTDNEITLHWETNSKAICYLEYYEDGNENNPTTYEWINTPTRSFTPMIEGLKSITLYQFDIFCSNATGSCSYGPVPVQTNPGNDDLPPYPVRDLYCQTPTSSAVLMWSAVEDIGSSGVLQYIIERSTDGTHWMEVTRILVEDATQDLYSYEDTTVTAGTYYFRILPSDAAGNVQSTSNNEIEIWIVANGKGSITGFVWDYINEVRVSSATLTLYNAENSIISTKTSDGAGEFTFDNIDSEEGYRIVASKSGYTNGVNAGIRVFPSETQFIGPIYMVNTSLTEGYVTGTIKNATNGNAAGNITVALYNTAGEKLAEKQSGVNSGLFNLPDDSEVPGGMYYITFRDTTNDFFRITYNNIYINGNINAGNMFMCPQFSDEPEARIVLGWGYNPQDLDLHLVGPCAPEFHCFDLSGYRSVCSNSIIMDSSYTAGYGPEEIQIIDFLDGQYYITVHNYSKADSQSNSDWNLSLPQVQIYLPNTGLRNRVYFPLGEGDAANETLWKAAYIQYTSGDLDIVPIIPAQITDVGASTADRENINNFK